MEKKTAKPDPQGEPDHIKTSEDLIKELFRKIEMACEKEDYVKSAGLSVATGFASLDRIVQGLKKGSLTIVTAQSGIGKSAFVHNMIRLLTVQNNVPVVFFTPEMPQEQVLAQICAAESIIPTGHVRFGNLRETEWPKLVRASVNLSQTNLSIDDTSPLPIDRIWNTSTRLKNKTKLDLIIIDSLIDLRWRHRYLPRTNREILAALKRLAKKLNVAVVMTSPLNNIVSAHKTTVTVLSDFDPDVVDTADLILMLDRETHPEAHDEQGELNFSGKLTVSVLKNRCGQTGQATLNLWRETMLVYDSYDGPPEIRAVDNEEE